jgi:hypothetical protein
LLRGNRSEDFCLFFPLKLHATYWSQAMSAGENVWAQISKLAATFDGDRDLSEATLDQFESELRSMPRSVRDEKRRQMIQAVAALSRLEVRMIASDGPLPTAI